MEKVRSSYYLSSKQRNEKTERKPRGSKLIVLTTDKKIGTHYKIGPTSFINIGSGIYGPL